MFIGSHLHADTLILTHMHTLTVSYMVTYLQTYTHSLTHTVTLTCTLTLSRGHTLINTYSHTTMYILKRTHNTHSHTHSNTLMHVFSHTWTFTKYHILSLRSQSHIWLLCVFISKAIVSMKIQWQGCHPFEACNLVSSEMTDKQTVEWRMCREKGPSHSCATTEILRLTSWERQLGRKCRPSRQGEGGSRVRISSMTGRSRARGTLSSGHCTRGNPGKCLDLYFLPFGYRVSPGLTRLVCEVMELRTELRYSSWASVIWIWIPRFFRSWIRTITCSPTTMTNWHLSRHQFSGPQIRGRRCLFQQALSFNLRSGSQHSPGKEPHHLPGIPRPTPLLDSGLRLHSA